MALKTSFGIILLNNQWAKRVNTATFMNAPARLQIILLDL